MADKKISALTAATTPLAGTEVLPIVQGGATVKVSVEDLTAGRSTQVDKLQVNGAQSTAGEIAVKNPAAGTENVLWAAEGATNTQVIAKITYDQNDDSLRIKNTSNYSGTSLILGTNDSDDVKIDLSGNLTVNTGNLVIGTSGKGVDFSATSGSGTSELLSDYEEGTWTPIDSSGASLSLTITGTSTYTKIGRQVIATADITYPVTVSASLTLVGGLPFTSGAGPSGAASIAYTDYGTWITASPGVTTTSFRFIGAGGFLTNANLSGKRVVVTVIYIV